jgi:hypothetical protein
MPAVVHLERHAELAESDLPAESTKLSLSMLLPLQTTIVVVVPHCLVAKLF